MRALHFSTAIEMKRIEENLFASFKAMFANSRPLLEVLSVYEKALRSSAIKQDAKHLTWALRHAKLS